MNRDETPPSGDWPSFRWEGSGWWFTIYGALATVFIFLAPDAVAMESGGRRLVAVALFASPLALLGVRHLVSVLRVFIQRTRWYPSVYRKLNELEDINSSLKRHLLELTETKPRCEISRVHWFQGSVYLSIRKKTGPQPEVGTPLVAFDTQDGKLMAELELTEIRRYDYYARVSGYIDPIWYGTIKAKELPETPPPPDTRVVLLKRGRES